MLYVFHFGFICMYVNKLSYANILSKLFHNFVNTFSQTYIVTECFIDFIIRKKLSENGKKIVNDTLIQIRHVQNSTRTTNKVIVCGCVQRSFTNPASGTRLCHLLTQYSLLNRKWPFTHLTSTNRQRHTTLPASVNRQCPFTASTTLQ